MPTYALYDALDLKPGCTDAEIKKAYRKKAIRCHPDKGGSEDEFKAVNDAHSKLTGMTDEERREYDRAGDEIFERPGQDFDPSDFFGGLGNMFGFANQRPRRNPRREDVVHEIRVSMEEAFRGATKSVRITIQRPCGACRAKCEACEGQGFSVHAQHAGFFTQIAHVPCRACETHGYVCSGKNGDRTCEACGGEGHAAEELTHALKLPKGVDTGFHVRLTGIGEQAVHPGDVSGDLIMVVRVAEHPSLKRRGHDLVHEARIPAHWAFCGGEVTVPHFDGPVAVDLRTLGILTPGKAYETGRKGMTSKGKLYVVFAFDYPSKTLSPEQAETLKKAFESVL